MAVALFLSSQFLLSPPKSSPFSPTSKIYTNNSIRLNKPCRITASATAERPRSTTSHYMSFASTSCATTLYQDLGISVGASFQEIKSAYRKLAKTCHPDAASADQKDASADEFMKIHAAYTTLSDPHKRMDYDRNLFKTTQPRSTPFSSYSASPIYAAASGYTRTYNWESDQCW